MQLHTVLFTATYSDSPSLLLHSECAIAILDKHTGLNQLSDELLRPLRCLQLALAVMQLRLELPDASFLQVEEALVPVAHGTKLLHLGPCAPPFAIDLHQVRCVALLRRDC